MLNKHFCKVSKTRPRTGLMEFGFFFLDFTFSFLCPVFLPLSIHLSFRCPLGGKTEKNSAGQVKQDDENYLPT